MLTQFKKKYEIGNIIILMLQMNMYLHILYLSLVIYLLDTKALETTDLSYIYLLLSFFFFFLQPHLQHMEVGLKGWSGAAAATYTTATATSSPSCICNLCSSLQQHQILTHWARSEIESVSSWTLCHDLNLLSHKRN